jgi:TolB-like protein/Tfp pilus assembly protein PilF
LAWAFEFTPEGLKWEKDVDRSAPVTRQTGKQLDRIIIVILALAVGFFAFDKFVLSESREAAIAESAREEGRSEAHKAKFYQSIAVLPFANRSNREDDVYFVDGVHDDILTQLAHIEALAVTSRTSVEQYRATTKTIKAIAEELEVRAILEGGVQRAGDQVRINVQLIDATNDDHLWAETYVRELTAANIFAVQGDIASSVASALAAALMPEEELALAAVPTESIEAYDLYLLGRYHWRQRTKEDIDKARGYFEQAIELDPDYALALSGLADSYTTLVIYGNMTGEEAYALAQQAIDQAMALDGSVSEVWSSLGFLRRHQLRLGESEEAFQRALELNDQNFNAWLWYSSLLIHSRRDAEALTALQNALEIEPMDFLVNRRLANLYDMIGDFTKAVQHYDRVDQLDNSDASGPQLEIAWSWFWAGEYARAIDLHRNILVNEPDSVDATYGLAQIYLGMGDLREAKYWSDRSIAINSFYRIGDRVLAAQQDYEGAIVYLEETLRLQSPRRNLPVLGGLFMNHYANGDIETARNYLAEIIDIQGGRLEVSPRSVSPQPQLSAAAFWITHGDYLLSEPERGRALADEIRDNLTKLAEMGWHRPTMLAILAGSEALLGNTDHAIDRLNEAIDTGFKNQERLLAHPAFDSIRESPAFAAAVERIAQLIKDEELRLASMELAPYAPPDRREPIAVAREILRNYEGWYSDGNRMSHVYLAEDGGLFGTHGPTLVYPLLALSENTFYSPIATEFTITFVTDETGRSTHFLSKTSYGTVRMKRVDDPPPTIELAPETLARYEGTFMYDRQAGLEGERATTDYWVAEVYVDEEGKVWIDFDNQPKLEIAAFSETEFQLVGMEAQYRFIVDPETGECNEFIRVADGSTSHFFRQNAD